MDGYKTYEGPRGDPESWREAFRVRMSLDEAREAIGDDSPEGILGVAVGATWSEIKKAYKIAALACHPDRAATNGMTVAVATEKFKRVQAAYTVLEERYGR
jgi:DnaJ-domain-containing protein 1